MTKKLSRLADSQNWSPAKRQHKSPEELVNVELIFWSVSINSGEFGDYIVAEVSLTETSEHFTVSTGSKQPVEVLMKCHLSDEFPLAGKFTRKGRRMYELV